MIYAAQYHGKECAAKIAYSKKNLQRSLREECELLVTLRHPCIVQLVGIFFTQDDPTSPVILMERMRMSLTELLVNKRSFQDKVTILHDVACGLCYIHNKNIIHCDLTGNNVLLGSNTNARIADFGQAVIYDPTSNNRLRTNPGNEYHMPPEASEQQYSTKLDIFSFGCVIIHTVTQEFPVPNCDRYIDTPIVGSYKKVSELDRRSALIQKLKRNHNSVQLHKIVVKCLQDHPDNRPTATVLHIQLKKCMEQYSKTDIHEESNVSYKNRAGSIQKWVKHYRGLFRLQQKSCKMKYKVYKLKRSIKYAQDLHRVSVTESVTSSTENYFAKVITGTGRLICLCLNFIISYSSNESTEAK